MVRASVTTGVGITTALLLLAGFAAAAPIALFDGGAQGQGEASGSYYADASGALDVADQTHADARDQVLNNWKATNSAYEETRNQLIAGANSAEVPAAPECPCDELFGNLEQIGETEIAHADSVTKAADLETGIVDAGADASAAGGVKAWFSDVFKGAEDAFSGLKSLFGVDTSAANDAKSQATEMLYADDELRGQITEILETEHELPRADPRLDGSLSGQHATEVTSSVLGQVQGEVP